MPDIVGFKEFSYHDLTEQKFKIGVYISYSLDEDTNSELKKLQDELVDKYSGIELEEHLHCTLIFSKEPCGMDIELQDKKIKTNFKRFSLFGENKDILVIELDSEELHDRYNYLTDKYGFISDFKSYKPHITLAHGFKQDLKDLEEINIKLVLENETSEELDVTK